MGNKVAVAFVHGIGTQDKYFADRFMGRILKDCVDMNGDDVVFRAIHWAEALQIEEDMLRSRLEKSWQPLSWNFARQLMVDFVADALAYQITKSDRTVYDEVHRLFAIALRKLAHDASAAAPLFIVAHSLGTVITSNYIYDLQNNLRKKNRQLIADAVKAEMTDTPLELGDTLVRLYTLGSPLALWSLRYENLGSPIRLASPPKAFTLRFPTLQSRWINIYDKDDVIGYPLKVLNADYDTAVYEDKQLEVGNLVVGNTPLAHMAYDDSPSVSRLIANDITEVWHTINP